MNFKKLLIGAFALSAMLAACVDDSTSAKDTDQSDELVETFDDLPVCSDNREGATAYVKDEKNAYMCVDGGWVPEEENSSSSIASSSSSPRNDSLSSSVIASSSSEAPQSSSSEAPQSSSSETTQSSSSETTQSSSSADVNSSSSENELSSSSEMGITYGTMTDSRDGKTYKTVKIGEQVWMAENLNYADSVKTPSLMGNSWCYDGVAANCEKYGRLYTWAVAIDSVKLAADAENPLYCGYGKECGLAGKVQGICPEGWHLPSYDEWKTLFTAVGGYSTAGEVLKSQTGWNGNGNSTDAFGFSALPAGSWSDYGGYDYEGYEAHFWSSAEYNRDRAYIMYLHFDSVFASLSIALKDNGSSVRCVKD